MRRGGRLLLRGKQRFTLQPREAAPQTFHPSRGAVCISQGMIMAVTRKLSELSDLVLFLEKKVVAVQPIT